MNYERKENYNLNPNKWIDTLPNINKEKKEVKFEEAPNEKIKNKNKKYSLTAIVFVLGLIIVSVTKNETRELQKEINNLRSTINTLKLNLHQITLDHEVITSPENVSKLAKENLEDEFNFYKKSQIKNLKDQPKKSLESNIKKKENDNFSILVKKKIEKKIEQKKVEIKKLQELYSNPESIPDEVRTKIAKKIERKKVELNNIYSSPKKIITEEKAQRWALVQVVKAFLGMPIIPGK